MNYLILFFIIFMLILGWINQKNKYLAYTIMIIFFILVCFSYDSYDYVNYNRMYDIVASGNTAGYEPLFELLMKGASILELNYDQFRMVCTAIEIALINSTIKRYCGNNAFVWSMFLVFPGWLLTILCRFTLGFSVIIFGVRYLIENSSKGKNHKNLFKVNHAKQYNAIKYIVCVVIAALIHSSLWIMLILLLVKKFRVRTIMILSCVVVGIIWITGGTGIASILTNVLFLRDSYVERLFSGTHSNFNGIVYGILRQAVIFIYGWLAVYFYKRRRLYKGDYVLEDRYMSMIVPINATGIMLLGVTYFTSNTRLSNVIILINLIGYGICINSIGRRTRITILLKIFALAVGIGLSYLMCTRESSDAFNMILKMFFETNKFINLFE